MSLSTYLTFDGNCREAFDFGMRTDRFGVNWMVSCDLSA